MSVCKKSLEDLMNNLDSELSVSRGEKVLSVVSSSVRKLRQEYTNKLVDLRNTADMLKGVSGELDKSDKKNQKLIGNLKFAVKSFNNLKTKQKKAIAIIQSFQAKHAQLETALDEANTTFELTTKELLSRREQIDSLENRYRLVCNAISPLKTESDQYKSFRTLLNDSLYPFINRVNVVANEAEQVMKISAIDDELRLADSSAGFSEKTIVAVAGGFSSGKSSLITSLFVDENVILPIGIEPVTAIPTYVFHSDTTSIRGYPKNGGYFKLPESIYARLSHKFIEEFGFNLRDLIPFMSLGVPMDSCRNLAFIDLPGYNPGDRGGNTSGDKSASDEFITQGQALIWVIGLDSNGTVSGNDIDHLWELSELDIPIYVVLNKADLRPAETLDEILDQVADELSINGISYEGISAYSSERGGEIKYRDRSLLEILEEWDKPRDKLQALSTRLLDIIETYKVAIEDDIKERNNKSSKLKSLELDLLEIGAFEEDLASSFDINKYMEESSEESDSSEKERVNKRKNTSRLINQIRDQLQSLNQDHCTQESKKSLDELIFIRNKVKKIMTTDMLLLQETA